MAHPQFLLLGYFDHSTIGRCENRPQPDAVRNDQVLVAATELFGPLMDFRSYVIPEDTDLCRCTLLQECDLCRQPCINEQGVFEVFLWKINGKTDLTTMICEFILGVKCEIVRINGLSSRLSNSDSMSRDLDYYSGAQFRKVIEEWQRFASQNAADQHQFDPL